MVITGIGSGAGISDISGISSSTGSGGVIGVNSEDISSSALSVAGVSDSNVWSSCQSCSRADSRSRSADGGDGASSRRPGAPSFQKPCASRRRFRSVNDLGPKPWIANSASSPASNAARRSPTVPRPAPTNRLRVRAERPSSSVGKSRDGVSVGCSFSDIGSCICLLKHTDFRCRCGAHVQQSFHGC